MKDKECALWGLRKGGVPIRLRMNRKINDLIKTLISQIDRQLVILTK